MHFTAQWRLVQGLGSNFGQSLLHIGRKIFFHALSVNCHSHAGSKLFEFIP